MKISCTYPGNTRLAYIHEGATITKAQETHYYPFGHRISPQSNQPVNLGTERNNAFLYNGKEFNDDFGLNWYDYSARFYERRIRRPVGIFTFALRVYLPESHCRGLSP